MANFIYYSVNQCIDVNFGQIARFLDSAKISKKPIPENAPVFLSFVLFLTHEAAKTPQAENATLVLA